jgi:hypothetical protein
MANKINMISKIKLLTVLGILLGGLYQGIFGAIIGGIIGFLLDQYLGEKI